MIWYLTPFIHIHTDRLSQGLALLLRAVVAMQRCFYFTVTDKKMCEKPRGPAPNSVFHSGLFGSFLRLWAYYLALVGC